MLELGAGTQYLSWVLELGAGTEYPRWMLELGAGAEYRSWVLELGAGAGCWNSVPELGAGAGAHTIVSSDIMCRGGQLSRCGMTKYTGPTPCPITGNSRAVVA